jgi:hypothetical protein
VDVRPGDLSWLESALAASAEKLIAARGGEHEESWQDALVRMTAAAAASVPGAVHAGFTLRTADRGLVSRAPSDEAIVRLDEAQADLGEGPCVEAMAPDTGTVIRVDDFVEDRRWPRFAALAEEAGIRSLLSYALVPHDAPPGAMNFYGTAARAFDDPMSRVVAGAFAMQAAVALYGAHRVANLTHALETRDVIGQAKGIVMERFRVDEQQAFDLLVRSSQDTNIKLVDVARWLTEETNGQAGEPPERLRTP